MALMILWCAEVGIVGTVSRASYGRIHGALVYHIRSLEKEDTANGLEFQGTVEFPPFPNNYFFDTFIILS